MKEQGPGGSPWRLCYSACRPSLACDFFKLTGIERAARGLPPPPPPPPEKCPVRGAASRATPLWAVMHRRCREGMDRDGRHHDVGWQGHGLYSIT